MGAHRVTILFLFFFLACLVLCMPIRAAPPAGSQVSVDEDAFDPSFRFGRWGAMAGGGGQMDWVAIARRAAPPSLIPSVAPNGLTPEQYQELSIAARQDMIDSAAADAGDVTEDDPQSAAERELYAWATPSSITPTGVPPVVVHIPMTKAEHERFHAIIENQARARDPNDPTGSMAPPPDSPARNQPPPRIPLPGAYTNRIRAIASEMGYAWNGPVSATVLFEYHLMMAHPEGKVVRGSHAAAGRTPPPLPQNLLLHTDKPHHKDQEDDAVDATMATRGQPNPPHRLRIRSDQTFYVSKRKWKRWSAMATSTVEDPPRGGDDASKDAEILDVDPFASRDEQMAQRDQQRGFSDADVPPGASPWARRMAWARSVRDAWKEHPHVATAIPQHPQMRTTRRMAPADDDPTLEKTEHVQVELDYLRKVRKEDLRGWDPIRMKRQPNSWMHYRERPTAEIPDNRPARNLDQMIANRFKRKHTDRTAPTAMPVADPLLTSEWSLYDASAWGDVPPGPAVHRPSISGGPVCWDYLGYSGHGIGIGVVDTGIEVAHPELADRYVRAQSVDVLNPHRHGDPTPVDAWRETHGTQVAGVALATRGNGHCGAGVAPAANLGVIRLLGLRSPTDIEEGSAISHLCRPHGTDPHTRNLYNHVFSSSWGPPDDGAGYRGPGAVTAGAMMECVHRVGRGGLGSVYVWAGGNGRTEFDDINYDGYANRPETIAVGAIDDGGKQARYSEAGAPLMVMAPSSGGSLGVVTSDPSGPAGLSATDCADTFGGTSAAAPAVAGVVALMLEASSNRLHWRDVQHILIRSAQRIIPHERRQPWTQNEAGYWHSHGYGFGLLNATKAVQMAEQWASIPHPAVVRDVPGLSAVDTWNERTHDHQRRTSEAPVDPQKPPVDAEEEQAKPEIEPEEEVTLDLEEGLDTRAVRLFLWTYRLPFRVLFWGARRAIASLAEAGAEARRARRNANQPVAPDRVRVVNDRSGNPAGVAIPPGHEANFTIPWPATLPLAHVEHVGMRIYVNTPAGRGKLRIELCRQSRYPQEPVNGTAMPDRVVETCSMMASGPNPNDHHSGINGRKWIFWTVRHWGEPAAGTWRLRVAHMWPRSESEGLRLMRKRVQHPDEVDAVVRWWQLEARGTHI